MKNDLLKYALLACLSLIGLASCQESDDTPEEFPDWQNKNEQAFLKIYKDAQDSIEAGKKWIIARGMNRAGALCNGHGACPLSGCSAAFHPCPTGTGVR